jgi:hypothetical protein
MASLTKLLKWPLFDKCRSLAYYQLAARVLIADLLHVRMGYVVTAGGNCSVEGRVLCCSVRPERGHGSQC